MHQTSLSASSVLAAFAEQLCTGRRVLVLGSSTSSLPALLLERGARLVHVADPDASRAAQATAAAPGGKQSFAAWNDAAALRENAFDVALIENLGAFEPTRTLREVRRVLGQRGVLLVASPNREAGRSLLPAALPSRTELDYYALYDAVSGEFEHVSMHGQAPFVGYAIAEFSPEGEIEPVIDSAFLPRGSEEPEFFVAVAAQHRVSAEGYAVVQLPIADVMAGGTGSAESAELERLRGGERQHRRRIAELEAMLKRSGQAAPVTSALEHKLARQDTWIRELEARATTADERADQAELELEEVRKELETLKAAPPPLPPPPPAPAPPPPVVVRPELEADLAAATERASGLDRELGTLRETLATLRETLAERDRRIEQLLGTEDAPAGEELSALEKQLVERGQEVRRLQRDLREAERIGRELLDKVKRGSASSATGDSELLNRLALAEADRQAAVWTAEALTARLERLSVEGRS
jgi:SAM-dependent methyltransferase